MNKYLIYFLLSVIISNLIDYISIRTDADIFISFHRIAVKELHQIINTLSNRHPPKILSTIYPSAEIDDDYTDYALSSARRP